MTKRNTKHDKQFKKGHIPWNKGLHLATNDNFSNKNKLGFKKGYNPWNKGESYERGPMPEWWKEKLRGIRLNARGEKNHKWKGGIGTIRHQLMGKYEYVRWRAMVFERDCYTCQDCGKSGIYLMAHHKKPWSEYPELRYELTNGITYCKECHAKNDKYYARFLHKRILT